MKIFRVQLREQLIKKVLQDQSKVVRDDPHMDKIIMIENMIVPFGPYSHECWDSEELREQFTMLQQSNEHEDFCWATVYGGRNDDISLRSGTKSLSDLSEWFGHAINHLKDNGFCIGVYSVDDVEEHSQSKQVRFRSYNARYINTLSLLTLKCC